MAGNTILEFADAFVEVLFADFAGFVLVAIVAGVGGVGLLVADVTGDDPFVAVVEREGMRRQQGGGPGAGGVATDAVEAEEAGVDLGFGVAAGAFARGVLELLYTVTGAAGKRGMGAIQGEDGVMIEAGHCVYAVVAGKAVGAKGEPVSGHEVWLGVCVTGEAVDGGGGVLALSMAIATGQGRNVVPGFVSRQAEAGLGVVENVCGDVGDGGNGALVFGMAFLAAGGVA